MSEAFSMFSAGQIEVGQLGERLEQEVEVVRAEADAQVVDDESLQVGGLDDVAALGVDGRGLVFLVHLVAVVALEQEKCGYNI